MTTITVNLDLDAVGHAVDRMFRAAPNSLLRNPLSEALAESFTGSLVQAVKRRAGKIEQE